MGKKKEKAVNVTCFTLNKIENMDTLHKINKIVNTNAHSKSYYTKMPKTYGLNSFLFTKKLHPRLRCELCNRESRRYSVVVVSLIHILSLYLSLYQFHILRTSSRLLPQL